MRFALVLLLLAACGKPCPYLCADNNDCPSNATCYQHEACLQGCLVCGGVCADSFHNCGGCGIPCADTQVCGRTGCVAACETGLKDCNHSCYDLKVDRVNCGACGHLCGPGENCVAGACRALASCG